MIPKKGLFAALVVASSFLFATPASARCRAGVEVGGACWFLSESGQSCSDVCAAVGFPYNEATRTYAGSDGTNAHCEEVLDALGQPGDPVFSEMCDSGLGCVKESDSSQRFRCTIPTDPDAENGQRACACAASGLAAPVVSFGGLATMMTALLALAAWGLRDRRRSV